MGRSEFRAVVHGATAVRLRRFVVVGASAAAVQSGLLWALVEVGDLNYLLAATLAIETTILLQYGANNAWTFQRTRHSGRGEYFWGMLRTNLVRGTAIPIQVGLLYGLVNGTVLTYLPANLIAIFVSGFYRYYLDSRWTWRIR